jgi:hypothetical protein
MWADVTANLLKVAEAQTVEDITERQTRPWIPGKSP